MSLIEVCCDDFLNMQQLILNARLQPRLSLIKILQNWLAFDLDYLLWDSGWQWLKWLGHLIVASISSVDALHVSWDQIWALIVFWETKLRVNNFSVAHVFNRSLQELLLWDHLGLQKLLHLLLIFRSWLAVECLIKAVKYDLFAFLLWWVFINRLEEICLTDLIGRINRP